MDQMKYTELGDITTLFTINEIKAYLRVDHNEDDTILSNMRSYALELIEGYSGVDFVSKQRQYFLPELPNDGVVVLPFANFNYDDLDVSGVSVKDLDDNSITDWKFMGLKKTQIKFNDSTLKDVIIEYTTPSQTLRSSTLQTALHKTMANLYDYRADFVAGKAINEVPSNVKELLDKFKTPFI